MKKFIVPILLLVFALFLSSCTSDNLRQSSAYAQETAVLEQDEAGALTPYLMQHDPRSFAGTIYVEGIVTGHERFRFALADENTDFVLPIDFRGSQAVPEVGSLVRVRGQMGYRSCCGPFLTSMRLWGDIE